MKPNTQNWKSFLPSRHFIVVISILAIGVGLFFGVRAIVNHYKKAQFVATTGLPPETKIGELLSTDTDKDGLLDWEESLWGLDPKNSDTNGDGVSDGEEVAAKKAALPGSEEENQPENLNDTEQFARDLFSTITALSQSGALNDMSIINLASALGDEITTKEIGDGFTSADLKISVTSKESIKNYHAKLAAIINKYPEDKIGKELPIMAEMFENNDTTKIKDLGIIASNYQSFAESIMTLSVPADIADKQLAWANSMHRISVSLNDVMNAFDNPLVSLSGFVTYTKESGTFIELSEEFRLYFKKNGIIK